MPRPEKPGRVSGFTLIELMVTLAILVLLLLAAVPMVNDWIYSAQVRDARGKVVQGYGIVKALALRNPGRAGATNAAAGLRAVTVGNVISLLVCTGNPADANCAAGGTAVHWQAALPANVGLAVAGVAAPFTLSLTNRGLPTTATGYTISRGGTQNSESGILY